MNNLRFGQNFIVKKTGDLSDPPQRYHFFQKQNIWTGKWINESPNFLVKGSGFTVKGSRLRVKG